MSRGRSLGGILRPKAEGQRRLADLSTLAPELRLTINEPTEMLRDGFTVLSLVTGPLGLIRLSFTVARLAGGHMQVFVGGVQKRQGS